MKLYRAETKKGLPIITVMAEGLASAGDEIRRELNKNESRRSLFRKWQADGMHVVIVERHTEAEQSVTLKGGDNIKKQSAKTMTPVRG